jgi:hypothetical protein
VGRTEAAGRWRCLGRRFANRGSGRGFGINGFYILIWSQPEVSRLAICVRSSGRGLYWAEIGLFLMLGFVFHVFFPLGGVVLYINESYFFYRKIFIKLSYFTGT